MSSNITRIAPSCVPFNLLSNETMDDLITIKQVSSKVVSALQNLSSLEEYVVIKRHYTEDRSFMDIARELKISRHAVGRLHDKAIKNLRENLAEFFSNDLTPVSEAA